jgi:hypothetical protein
MVGVLRLGQAWKVCTTEEAQKAGVTDPVPFTAEVILLNKPVRTRPCPMPRQKLVDYKVDTFSRSDDLLLPCPRTRERGSSCA